MDDINLKQVDGGPIPKWALEETFAKVLRATQVNAKILDKLVDGTKFSKDELENIVNELKDQSAAEKDGIPRAEIGRAHV